MDTRPLTRRANVGPLALLISTMLTTTLVTAFQPAILRHQPPAERRKRVIQYMSDDWSSFQAFDDDDDLVFDKAVDRSDYAVEDDSQEVKAAVGSARKAPEIDRDAAPIQVTAGTLGHSPNLENSELWRCCVLC